jgi:hypothetical protein
MDFGGDKGRLRFRAVQRRSLKVRLTTVVTRSNPNPSKPGQIFPSRGKINQRKVLGFPCISLSESSLFKALRPPPLGENLCLARLAGETAHDRMTRSGMAHSSLSRLILPLSQHLRRQASYHYFRFSERICRRNDRSRRHDRIPARSRLGAGPAAPPRPRSRCLQAMYSDRPPAAPSVGATTGRCRRDRADARQASLWPSVAVELPTSKPAFAQRLISG